MTKLNNKEKLILKAIWLSVPLAGGVFVTAYAISAEDTKKVQKHQINNLAFEVSRLSGTPILTNHIDTQTMQCLTVNAVNEAGHNNNDVKTTGYEMSAITATVLNRAREQSDVDRGGNRLKTACDVIYKSVCGKGKAPCFSWVNNKKFHQTFTALKSDKNLKWKMDLATDKNKKILSLDEPFLKSVQFYNNPRVSDNRWHLNKVAEGVLSPIGKIGETVFYSITAKGRKITEGIGQYIDSQLNADS